MDMTICPCRKSASAQLSYAECCQPYIEGRAQAPSPEALMRARYSAFAVGAIDYLIDMERGSLEAWSKESQWHGLDIVETVDGKPGDKTGIVEFTAHFSRLGKREAHYERSSFRFDEAGQRWYFVEGGKPKGKTVVKGAQVGRNDPCTCGSAKKFKKCCGAAA